MKAGLSLFLSTLLVGCAAAPAVMTPLPSTPLPKTFKGVETVSPEADSESKVAWWDELQVPALDALVQEALARNADIEVAVARLEQSRALLAASRSAAYPRVDLSAGVTRSRASLGDPALNPAAPRSTSRWTADSAVSWEADLFGRLDAQAQAQALRAASAEARVRAARMAVAADVVSRALECAALQTRIDLALEALAAEQQLFELATAKVRGGQAPQQDVQRAEAQINRNQAGLAQLRISHAEALSALAVLLDSTPEDVATKVATLKLPASDSKPPRATAPSDLLLSRPDVQVAMAELRAASADLAAVAADRFPRFDIGASLGFVAATASRLGTAGALAASLAPDVRWRALDFGELDARIQDRKGAERAAAAEYKAAVMRAFAESQTAITQLQQRRERLAAAMGAAKADSAVWEVQRARFEAGLADLAPTLKARLELNASIDASIQAQLDALAGQVLLNKSLGRGAEALQQRP